MAVRNAEAFVGVRKMWDEKAERIRAATLTAEDRESLKHIRDNILVPLQTGGHPKGGVATADIAVIDRLLSGGGK